MIGGIVEVVELISWTLNIGINHAKAAKTEAYLRGHEASSFKFAAKRLCQTMVKHFWFVLSWGVQTAHPPVMKEQAQVMQRTTSCGHENPRKIITSFLGYLNGFKCI